MVRAMTAKPEPSDGPSHAPRGVSAAPTHATRATQASPSGQATSLRPLPQGDGAEEALAARAAQGDTGAFDALVTLFSARVFAVAVRLLQDRAEAEDLSQEVFVALYHALPTFRGESRLSTWIYRITRNRCLNRLKFLKRRHVGSHADIDDPIVGRAVTDPETDVRGARDADRKIARTQVSVVLERHLRELPEEQRVLVVLRDL